MIKRLLMNVMHSRFSRVDLQCNMKDVILSDSQVRVDWNVFGFFPQGHKMYSVRSRRKLLLDITNTKRHVA